MARRVLVSLCHDVHVNLAAEEALLNIMAREVKERAPTPTLFLYRNYPAVVMGRFQNPWVEASLGQVSAYLAQQGAPHTPARLARRISGGGCVYHDLGNTNMCFMAPRRQYDPLVHAGIVLSALQSLGVHNARVSPRKDVELVRGEGVFKISGTAESIRKDVAFHHCSMLLHSDLDAIAAAVLRTRDPAQISGRVTTKSVKSKVANVSTEAPGIEHTSFVNALIAAAGGATEVVPMDEAALLGLADDMPALVQRQRDWDWTLGATPEFTHHIAVAGPQAGPVAATGVRAEGSLVVGLVVRKGRVADVVPDASPHAGPCAPEQEALVTQLRERLVEQRYDPDVIRSVAAQVTTPSVEHALQTIANAAVV